MNDKSLRMPAIFFGHGNPMNALQNNRYTEAWRRIGTALPRPKAILAISAHWYTHGTAVTAAERPKTIHDFRGFPPELFAVRYPAPGDAGLAARVRETLAPMAVPLDHSWGLDHGTWSVLVHAYPDADIPIVQLSIDATQPARFHYTLGQRLASLRDEGVLIAGSGNVVHNLRLMNWDGYTEPYEWAFRFNGLVREHLEARNHAPLIAYDRLGMEAQLAVPTPDHYLPFLYIIALQTDEDPLHVAVDGIEHGSVGMLSFVVGKA